MQQVPHAKEKQKVLHAHTQSISINTERQSVGSTTQSKMNKAECIHTRRQPVDPPNADHSGKVIHRSIQAQIHIKKQRSGFSRSHREMRAIAAVFRCKTQRIPFPSPVGFSPEADSNFFFYINAEIGFWEEPLSSSRHANIIGIFFL